MFRWLLLVGLSACATSQATAPNLTLVQRFDLVAFRSDSGDVYDTLWRWDRPISVRYVGPEEYRRDVVEHAMLLGELTGKPVIIDGDFSAMTVEISNRETDSNCQFESNNNGAEIHIWVALSPAHIRRCVLQEMTQALGLPGDLDGVLGSRSDTVFASYQTADHLTEADIALIKILYDRRLYHGMPRDEAMAVVRQIVAEMEASEGVALEAPR